MRLRSVLVVLLVVAACSNESPPPAATAFDEFAAAVLPGEWRANGDQVVEVWVCHVPAGTTAAVYGELPLRVPLAPSTLAAVFQRQVALYFHRVSHGRYSPSFVAGGEITMAEADGPAECVDAALSRSGADADVVLAVADAEHAAGEPGGMGNRGDARTVDSAAAVSRRYAYVGASDFNRISWGDSPPLDLVEHELGHTLGWVHSAVDDGPPPSYRSGIDVMSNSAAPRDVDPARRDAPDTIALQRMIAGWIASPDVAVVDDDRDVTLIPSNADAGLRVAVLPVDDRSFLTVEVLDASGYNGHLAAGGVTVHRVELGADALPMRVEPLVGGPHAVELLAPGAEFSADGWTMHVVDDSGRVGFARSP